MGGGLPDPPLPLVGLIDQKKFVFLKFTFDNLLMALFPSAFLKSMLRFGNDYPRRVDTVSLHDYDVYVVFEIDEDDIMFL